MGRERLDLVARRVGDTAIPFQLCHEMARRAVGNTSLGGVHQDLDLALGLADADGGFAGHLTEGRTATGGPFAQTGLELLSFNLFCIFQQYIKLDIIWQNTK